MVKKSDFARKVTVDLGKDNLTSSGKGIGGELTVDSKKKRK